MGFNYGEQTGWQRAVRGKEEGLLMTDGVTLGTSLLKNRSAVRTSAVSMRPYYLPREFTQVIVCAVYVPPSANADAACDVLHSVTSSLQTLHPQAFFLISWDFNHASLSSTLPTFTQYVTCHTRDNKTLDLLYVNIKEAYNYSSPLPPLGRSDHNLVHLLPVYKPLVNR